MFFKQLNTPSTYFLIDTPKKLSWLVDQLLVAKEFAYDIETDHPTSKSEKVPKQWDTKLGGIAFAWGRDKVTRPWTPGLSAYIPIIKSNGEPYWKDKQQAVLDQIKRVLESDIPKIAHNGKFDNRELLLLNGIRVKNFTFCTYLAHAILDEDRVTCFHRLKSTRNAQGEITTLGVSDAYLDLQNFDFKGELDDALEHYDPVFKRYTKVPLDVLAPYGCADTDLTLSLKFVFDEMLKKENLSVYFQQILMPIQDMVKDMEVHGAPLDIEHTTRLIEQKKALMRQLEPRVIEELGQGPFNIGSAKQLGHILFDVIGIEGGKRNEKSGDWKVDSATLDEIDHPALITLKEWKRCQHMVANYMEPALIAAKDKIYNNKIGLVRSTYFLDSATGRLKSQAPNLSNLPKPEKGGIDVKSCYACPPGYWMIFKDYSQIELRVIAHISKDQGWIEAFINGYDMHSATAKKLFKLPCTVEEVGKLYKPLRSKAKGFNFGVPYGASAHRMHVTMGIPIEEAEKLMSEFFATAPGVGQFIELMHYYAKNYGYVNNIFGRVRHLPNAGLPEPATVQWPPKYEMDNLWCYRKGPTLKELNISNEIDPNFVQEAEMYALPEKEYSNRVKRLKKWSNCHTCNYVKSCVVNRHVKATKGKISHALRQSVNSPIQGSAVEMLSMSMVWMAEEFEKKNIDARPILHIHDEVCVFVHEDHLKEAEAIMEDCMVRRMQEYTGFSVPLVTDTEIVQRWSDKHINEKAFIGECENFDACLAEIYNRREKDNNKLGTPQNGMWYHDKTAKQTYLCNGTEWVPITTGPVK